MRTVLGAGFACLMFVALDAAETRAGPAPAVERVAEAAPPAAGPENRPRRSARRLDRYGHEHDRRPATPAEGPAVAPPEPIPSPHYYWRG